MLGGGLLVQYSVQLRGMSGRNPDWFTSPLWALGNYVTRVAPRAIFGELALGGPGTNGEGHTLPLNIQDPGVHTALVWGAWGLLAVADRHRADPADRTALGARGDRPAVQRAGVRR